MLLPTAHLSFEQDPPDMAQRHLRKVKKAAEEVWRARRALDLAIIEAYESGETLRDIGDWAGVGHQRIHQIIKDSRHNT